MFTLLCLALLFLALRCVALPSLPYQPPFPFRSFWLQTAKRKQKQTQNTKHNATRKTRNAKHKLWHATLKTHSAKRQTQTVKRKTLTLERESRNGKHETHNTKYSTQNAIHTHTHTHEPLHTHSSTRAPQHALHAKDQRWLARPLRGSFLYPPTHKGRETKSG